MNKVLLDFYSKIETEYEIDDNSWSLFAYLGDMIEEDKLLIGYEYCALNKFESYAFEERISKEKEQIIAYFRQRVETTKNIHLLAKYYHFLLYLSKNNVFASKSIEYYQHILAYYLSIYDQDLGILHFSETLGIIISISTRYKIQEKSIKEQINNYLYDATLSSKIKTFIFENIRDCKLFRSGELADYPRLCIELSNEENDTNIKERLLNLAVTFSRKTTNTDLFKTANELLGDFEYGNILPFDDKNIAISHLNENCYKKIINHYKAAGQKEKQTIATKELEENKKKHKYIKFQTKVPCENVVQINNLTTEHLENILKNTPEVLMHILCFNNGNILLFPPYNKVQESVKEQMNSTLYHQFFESKLVDINGNISSIPHEAIGEHQLFQIWLNNYTFPFVLPLLGRAIQERKLSYTIVKSHLLKTSFGIQLKAMRGDKELLYNWLSFVDIGIKEFFRQFSKIINEKHADWRFTIDFLTPKFEAILRDIIQNSGGEVTRVKDNGDTELKPLEDLFSSPVIKEIFNEDDVFLFKHTFTKAGLNIRNDVAHGLCKPFDYSLSKAILVLLCVLRLNKVLRL